MLALVQNQEILDRTPFVTMSHIAFCNVACVAPLFMRCGLDAYRVQRVRSVYQAELQIHMYTRCIRYSKSLVTFHVFISHSRLFF